MNYGIPRVHDGARGGFSFVHFICFTCCARYKIILVETHYTKLDPQFIDKLREAFEALLLPRRRDFMPKILPSTEDIRTACHKGAGLAIIERFFDDMD